MDFTREPIIETIITPKEGYKIVVRSSKTLGQEEYFVDAVEVVTFGGASFFRSLERPKAFLVPVSDYEVLEVREARVVLKNVGLDRSIKIAGGREGQLKSSKEEAPPRRREERGEAPFPPSEAPPAEGGRSRQGRRRGRGRRRGEEEGVKPAAETPPPYHEEKIDLESPKEVGETAQAEGEKLSTTLLSGLLTPPPLISETLHRYRDNALFQSAFYTKEELESAQEEPSTRPQPEFGVYETTEEEEAKIWESRNKETPANGMAPNE